MGDAAQVLSTFMIDGMPDRALFRGALIPLIERACRGRIDCVIRAYGEMVDVLWQSGKTVAATRLEMLGNDLAQTHDFGLVCGYSLGQFYKNAAVATVCGHHTHVISASGEASLLH